MRSAHSGEGEREQSPALGGPRRLTSLLRSHASSGPGLLPLMGTDQHSPRRWVGPAHLQSPLSARRLLLQFSAPAFGLRELPAVSPQRRPRASSWVPSLSCSLEAVLRQSTQAIPGLTSFVSQGRELSFTHQVVDEPFTLGESGPWGRETNDPGLSCSWELTVWGGDETRDLNGLEETL